MRHVEKLKRIKTGLSCCSYSDWNIIWWLCPGCLKGFLLCVIEAFRCNTPFERCWCFCRWADSERSVPVPGRAVHLPRHRVPRHRHLLQQCPQRRGAQRTPVHEDHGHQQIEIQPAFTDTSPKPSPVVLCVTEQLRGISVDCWHLAEAGLPWCFRFSEYRSKC